MSGQDSVKVSIQEIRTANEVKIKLDGCQEMSDTLRSVIQAQQESITAHQRVEAAQNRQIDLQLGMMSDQENLLILERNEAKRTKIKVGVGGVLIGIIIGMLAK